MTSLPISTLRSHATTHAKHTRGCKKAIDACPTCVAIVAWFRNLPAPVLSQVLEDRGKPMKQYGAC